MIKNSKINAMWKVKAFSVFVLFCFLQKCSVHFTFIPFYCWSINWLLFSFFVFLFFFLTHFRLHVCLHQSEWLFWPGGKQQDDKFTLVCFLGGKIKWDANIVYHYQQSYVNFTTVFPFIFWTHVGIWDQEVDNKNTCQSTLWPKKCILHTT